LERTFRIDAEFFHKRHLEYWGRIVKVRHESVNFVARISDGNHFSISDRFQEEGIPYYRGQDVVGHFFVEQSSPVCIDGKTFNEAHLRRSHLKKGDVLLSIVGTIGELSLVTSNQSATCSCKLAILRPKQVPSAYLAVFLVCKYGKSQIQRYTRGAVQMGLLLEDMDQIHVPRFTPDFENAVASFVEKARLALEDGKIKYREAENTLLAELGLLGWQSPEAMSYERKASEAFLAGRLDAEYFDPGAVALIQQIRYFGSFRIGEYSQVLTGFPWKSEYFIDNQQPGEPFVRIRNCKPGAIDIDEIDRLDAKYAVSQNQSKAQPGDLVVGMDGLKWFYASLIVQPCYVNQRVTQIKTLAECPVSSEYLMLVINSKIGQTQYLRQMTIAHTVGHITNEDTRQLLIPLIKPEIHSLLQRQVQQSLTAKQKAKTLLERAKRAVEIAIETDETAALEYLHESNED
jgi:hypothetical protein